MRGREPHRVPVELPRPTQSSFKRLDHIKARPNLQVATGTSDGKLAAPAQLEAGNTVYAIGDVHGRADLLDTLVDVIAEDCKKGFPR